MFLLAESKSFGKVFSDALLGTLRSELFILFLVLAGGYLIGRIKFKGVSFGSSGVFLFAIIAGVLLSKSFSNLGIGWIKLKDGNPDYAGSVIKVVKNIGLVLFITSIGFISGPKFIRNFKKKAGSFITMSLAINIVAIATCVIIIAADSSLDASKGSGILMGALSSTPGLSSAQGFFADKAAEIAALSALAYPFGVLGVVLFVQLVPKILRKDMAVEIEKLRAGMESSAAKAKSVAETAVTPNPAMAEVKPIEKKMINLDKMGLCVFALAAALGLVLGALTFKLTGSAKFSLGTTGGTLIMGLLFGHFGKVGRVSLKVPETTLKVTQELGLVLFLAASGLEGGIFFLESFKVIYLLYGAIMTLLPMIVGFFVGKILFKMEMLNNLGTICGGMTSTPALGALEQASGTSDVAHSYAAAYPISLFVLVFVPQIISLIC